MRLAFYIIFFCFPMLLKAQEGLTYVFEELPADTTFVPEKGLHTSLKPQVLRYESKQKNYVSISALTDLNYFQNTSPNYKTGLGLEFKTFLNNKWYFRLAGIQGMSNLSRFMPMSYLNQRTEKTDYLYTDIRSRISYTPNHIFNFQVGLDHNFLGEGSRSLFLGDYGRPYPFGLIRTKFWRLEYAILYQFMREGAVKNWEGKFASSHHLSINLAKWLNVGIFESVVFQPKDSSLSRGFDVEYLNPLVFYRPQEYSVGSSDNVLLGVDLTVRFKKHQVYGQLILDEFYLSEIKSKSGWWANKYGVQAGVKGKVLDKLFYRVEYNFVRPYAYSHISDELNYSNQGTALAHPYGANFMEILGELKYQNKNWLAKVFTNYYLKGNSINNFNYGEDIFEPYINRPYDYGHFVGNGAQENGFTGILSLAYQFANHGKLSAFAENQIRYQVQEAWHSYMLVVGIRSMLWNDHRNY